MLQIENEYLTVEFSTHGAEMTRIYAKHSEREVLWHADPQFWGRHAPVLFPIVGRLKNNRYQFDGQTYELSGHGFARDLDFEVIEQSAEKISFELTETAETLVVYPFRFSLKITYLLNENNITVIYHVENPDNQQTLYFSIGAHPAFNVPMNQKLSFEDYQLSIAPNKARQIIPLQAPLTDFAHAEEKIVDEIELTRETFKNDAITFKTHANDTFFLGANIDSKHHVTVNVDNAVYTGIWSPYPEEAPFVCIEPWWGIADDIDFEGDLTQKRGINALPFGEKFEGRFEINID